MKLPASVLRQSKQLRASAKKHQLLILVLLALVAATVSSRFLTGQLIPGLPNPATPTSTAGDPPRSCSAEGTPFAATESIVKILSTYRTRMNEVVNEHEKILKTPSEWKCGPGDLGEPSIPKLQALAKELPGWSGDAKAVGVERAVTFDSFVSVVSEFQRTYECVLLARQEESIKSVMNNMDLESDGFCCSNQACVPTTKQTKDGKVPTGVLCAGPVTQDPLCGNVCPVLVTSVDLATRPGEYMENIDTERQRSRNAVERTLQALRSYELNYAIARQLTCYQRASLDLRNEMSLLADAMSCIPKIWDAVTSIHDPGQP